MDKRNFSPLLDERVTRMRRLRLAAQQTAILRAEFTAAARAWRLRVLNRIAADPSVAVPLLIPAKGPFGQPDYVFEQAAWDALLN
jgi:hypothetical protein